MRERVQDLVMISSTIAMTTMTTTSMRMSVAKNMMTSTITMIMTGIQSYVRDVLIISKTIAMTTMTMTTMRMSVARNMTTSTLKMIKTAIQSYVTGHFDMFIHLPYHMTAVFSAKSKSSSVAYRREARHASDNLILSMSGSREEEDEHRMDVDLKDDHTVTGVFSPRELKEYGFENYDEMRALMKSNTTMATDAYQHLIAKIDSGISTTFLERKCFMNTANAVKLAMESMNLPDTKHDIVLDEGLQDLIKEEPDKEGREAREAYTMTTEENRDVKQLQTLLIENDGTLPNLMQKVSDELRRRQAAPGSTPYQQPSFAATAADEPVPYPHLTLPTTFTV